MIPPPRRGGGIACIRELSAHRVVVVALEQHVTGVQPNRGPGHTEGRSDRAPVSALRARSTAASCRASRDWFERQAMCGVRITTSSAESRCLPPVRLRREDLPLLVTQTLLGGGHGVNRVTTGLLRALADGSPIVGGRARTDRGTYSPRRRVRAAELLRPEVPLVSADESYRRCGFMIEA